MKRENVLVCVGVVTIAFLFGLACYGVLALQVENDVLKHELAVAKLDAGRPINAADLPLGYYTKFEDKSYAFVKRTDELSPPIAVYRDGLAIPASFSVGFTGAGWEKHLDRVIKED